MVSTMPFWLKPLSFLFVLTLLTVLGFMPAASRADFTIQYAQTRLVDTLYVLDANLDYQLSDSALEALKSGVTLTFVLSIEVKRERWYFLNQRLLELKQRYQLRYHALSNKYVLTYTNTGIQENFSSVSAALATMGRLTDFPLIDSYLVKQTETYWVALQTQLDIEALPAPLRPVAYFSSQWHLASDWYLCPLTLSIPSSTNGKDG